MADITVLCGDSFSEKSSSNVQSLPCSIDYNGPANVSKFFTPFETKSDGDSLIFEASFRGRQLFGKELKVPEPYAGVVLQETSSEKQDDGDVESENQEGSGSKKRKFEAVSQFHSFLYWNRDIEPQKGDRQQMLLKWLSMSEVIHGPPDEPPSDFEAISARIKRKKQSPPSPSPSPSTSK